MMFATSDWHEVAMLHFRTSHYFNPRALYVGPMGECTCPPPAFQSSL